MAPPHPAPPDPAPPHAKESGAEQSRAEPGAAKPGAAKPAAAEPAAAKPAAAEPTAAKPTATPPAAIPARPKARSLPPAGAATRQRAVAALFLALLSLFGLLGLNNLQRGVYIAAFALVAAALAVWLGSTSISRARRGGTMSPRASVTAIAIGAIGVLLSGLLLVGFAAFGKQVATYTQCLSGANTIAAQQACKDQLVHAVEGRASGR
jgi:outer membrane biosynthesis protein TonB